MAHPIRPESYITMDNFYTLTVYEKGALGVLGGCVDGGVEVEGVGGQGRG